jgi:hypothetical protein
MADKEAAKTGAAVGAGALLGTALALFFARKAQAAPPEGTVSLDEAAMSALLAIAQEAQNLEGISSNTNQANGLLNQIANQLGATGGIGQNPNSFVAFEICPSTASIPARLPDIPIPFKAKVVLKAKSTNTGAVYVARSEAELQLPASRYYLNKNETIALEVDNTKRIYLMAAIANEGVAVIVEHWEVALG